MTQLATITSKRQLTIPSLIFQKLGLKTGQKVLISEDQGTIKIEPALELIENLAGSVKIPARFRKLTPKKMVTKAKKEYFNKP